MSLVKFSAANHPQQVGRNGARDEVDDRATSPEVFDPLNERFGFTLDVAAAGHNTKCSRWYDREADGLLQRWRDERVWCNPPYSNIGAWVRKAWDEWGDLYRPQVIVMLLPANRTEQAWWQDHVEPHRDQPGSPLRVEFLRGRLRFLLNGATAIKPNQRPPFGCCLLIWQETGAPCPVCARPLGPEPHTDHHPACPNRQHPATVDCACPDVHPECCTTEAAHCG